MLRQMRLKKALVNKYSEHMLKAAYFEPATKTKQAVTIPVEAFNTTEENMALVQYKADKLNEFRERYGVSAKQLLLGDIKGMTLKQAELIEQEMQVLGVNNYISFCTI